MSSRTNMVLIATLSCFCKEKEALESQRKTTAQKRKLRELETAEKVVRRLMLTWGRPDDSV